MLHAKFQDHQTSGFEGEENFRFHHIRAWRPSWLRELDHLYKIWFSSLGGSTKMASICNVVFEKEIFENNVNVHVHDSTAGADNALGSFL